MAKLRKFSAYRRRESRPYTRKSKYREKSFIRASPTCKVIRFDMGNLTSKFEYAVHLSVNSSLQIRHNALESARLTSNRTLEKSLGKSGFYLKLRKYPHHFLRENPLASGAGADRMSTGMKCAFGKIVGMAAQFRPGDRIFSAYVNSSALNVAKSAMNKASKKLPCSCKIVVEKIVTSEKPAVLEEVVDDVKESVEDKPLEDKPLEDKPLEEKPVEAKPEPVQEAQDEVVAEEVSEDIEEPKKTEEEIQA